MKKLIALLVVLLIAGNAFCADITFTIPDEKLERVKDGMLGLYPVPRDEEGEPIYSENVWLKMVIREWIITQVARYEQRKAQQAVGFNKDYTLVEE